MLHSHSNLHPSQHSVSTTPLERSISILFPDSVLSSSSSVYTFSRSISFLFPDSVLSSPSAVYTFSCIMYMASSRFSSFTFTKVDLPVCYLQRIRKNLLAPSLSRKSLFSYRTPTVSLPHVYRTATTTVSRLDDHVIDDPTKHNTPQLEVHSSTWNWRGFSIRYQHSGNSGPALVLVHGFGANSDHWRKNIPVLARSHRVFSIDLIGYGYSDKPNPREYEEPFYTFETWATQLNEFCIDVVKDKAYFVCNSIGGVVGLQAAVMEPETCMGIMLLNISLRMLHTNKQPWYGRPVIGLLQNLLRNTALGNIFYKSVAKPDSIRSILSQVTDELVQAILLPGLQPGAGDVFLEFICYSGGPLPEELLPLVKCPVLIAWGDKDPWEPIELGRTFGKFDSVEDFIVIPNVGHCPQDEAPHLVNQLIESFVARHAKTQASLSPKII